jgi:hypothetical protein
MLITSRIIVKIETPDEGWSELVCIRLIASHDGTFSLFFCVCFKVHLQALVICVTEIFLVTRHFRTWLCLV